MRRFAIFWVFILIGCSGGSGTPPSNNNTENKNNDAPSGGATATAGWLATSGNHIVRSDGSVWVGRGANLHDTRSCGDTTEDGAPLHDNQAGLGEVKRRIDALTGDFKADFLRLALESRRSQDNYLSDENYRSLVKQIVDYIGTKPGVYVMISIWFDPSLDKKGWPTDTTNQILAQLARDFYDRSYVMFGVSNEPEENYEGALDAQVFARMNSAVAAIRAVEAEMGNNRHLVAVQGTREWARDLNYYVTHPITAGGGVNVIYETHVYNAPNDFDTLFLSPGKTLPVVIGEFGPVDDESHKASVADMEVLMNQAAAAKIPYLAWTFHQNCSPNLISDQAGKTWSQNSAVEGIGMPLIPTDFGNSLKANLQK